MLLRLYHLFNCPKQRRRALAAWIAHRHFVTVPTPRSGKAEARRHRCGRIHLPRIFSGSILSRGKGRTSAVLARLTICKHCWRPDL